MKLIFSVRNLSFLSRMPISISMGLHRPNKTMELDWWSHFILSCVSVRPDRFLQHSKTNGPDKGEPAVLTL